MRPLFEAEVKIRSKAKLLYRVVQKRHRVSDTISLQPYVVQSCGFQQNVPKKILYMTKVSVEYRSLTILCHCRWQLNYAKQYYPQHCGP